MLVYFGIFLIVLNFYKAEDLSRLAKVAALSVFPVSVFGVYQHFSGVMRVYSTIGQPNWLAAYLGMLLPVAFYFSLQNLRERYYWLILFLSGFSCLWFTYSVSGLMGFGIAMTLFVCLNYPLIKTYLVQSALVLLIMFIVVVTNLGVMGQRVEDIYTDVTTKISLISKVYAQAVPLPRNFSDPGLIRRGLWEGTLKLAFSSPRIILLGTGPETFPYHFPAFRPALLNYSSEWNYIFNKPHNYYLELLSQLGIFGLISYLVIALRVLKTRHPFLSPMLAGFFVTNIFGWPTVATSLLFWVFLGLMGLKGGQVKLGIGRRLSFVLITLAGILVVLFQYSILNIYSADVAFRRADKYLSGSDIERGLVEVNKAIFKNPQEPIYLRWRAKMYIAASLGMEKEMRDYLKGLALADLEKAYNLNPKNLATLRNSVPLYYFLALGDEKYLPIALSYFEKLEQLSSTDVGIEVLLLDYKEKLGQAQEAEKNFLNIQKLRPDLLEWHPVLQDFNVSL